MLVDRIDAAPGLTVVVFRSDNPDYLMAHLDLLADRSRVATTLELADGHLQVWGAADVHDRVVG